MNEQTILKKQLIFYTINNFFVFFLVFLLIGSIVFGLLNKCMYSIVDRELLDAKERYFNPKIGINKEFIPRTDIIFEKPKIDEQIRKKP